MLSAKRSLNLTSLISSIISSSPWGKRMHCFLNFPSMYCIHKFKKINLRMHITVIQRGGLDFRQSNVFGIDEVR